MGHGINPRGMAKYCIDTSENSYNYFYDLGNEVIDQYFFKTFKPTEEIIKNQEEYFASLKNVREIFVLGHSLSTIDQCYFQKIINSVGRNSFWVVSYFNPRDIFMRNKFLNSLGITNNRLKFSGFGKCKK